MINIDDMYVYIYIYAHIPASSKVGLISAFAQ